MKIRVKSKLCLVLTRDSPRKIPGAYKLRLTFLNHAGRKGSYPLLTAALLSPF